MKRLAEHQVVRVARRGTMQLVDANWELPWAIDLQRLLAKTIGPLGVLAEELAKVVGPSAAWVYGSWAERFEGTPGPFPRDIDVLIVGDLPLGEAYVLARRVEQRLGGGLEVNPTVISSGAWAERASDPFLSTVAARALIAIPLAGHG